MTFESLTLKVVSESRDVFSVPILVFLGLSVLDLGLMYVKDRRQTKALLIAPPIRGRGIITGRLSTNISCVYISLCSILPVWQVSIFIDASLCVLCQHL